MKGAGWVNLLLGIWLLVSPFALHLGHILTTNNLACGPLVILAALWSLMVSEDRHLAGWIGVMLGFWVFSAPWSLGVVAGAVPLANEAMTGALLIIFAIVRTLNAPLPSQRAA